MVRYLFYTIGDLTYQSPLVDISYTCVSQYIQTLYLHSCKYTSTRVNITHITSAQAVKTPQQDIYKAYRFYVLEVRHFPLKL